VSALPAADAGTWRLGDLEVRRLGFGTMRLTGSKPFHHGVPRDRSTSIAVLRRAVELGVNHIDTAAFYFSRLRSAAELVNSALAPYPDDLVIATKVGPRRDAAGEWVEWARPEELRGQVEENLRLLGRDHLDLVNYRSNGRDSISEQVGALAEMKEAGLLRHIGVSGVTAERLEEARAVAEIVSVQNRHGVGASLPDADSLIERCHRLGIAFVPFFAVAGQARETGTVAEHPAVLEIAAAHDATPAQVRIAWTLGLGPHVLAIPGTGDPGHLEANVAAAAIRLDEDEVTRLAAVQSDRAR
jgi:pyridoxine 4-dehydrogenase